ncbi:MAG TPA: FAD-dependent oxidoreductase, partial [Alphaproteobacteria bacterium]|nr:FAD-dependent oxidoreductase [Alphaproteobacteria bacterium]
MSTTIGGDVIVVGGGLIGLSIAFELAQRGATVRVYDRGEPGRGASWAGAGMLAP